MTDTHKMLWNNVLAKSPQELSTRKGHQFFAVIAVVVPGKAYPSAVDVLNSVVADGNFVGVTTQVFNNLLRATKRLFGIHHPLRLIKLADKLRILGQLLLKHCDEFCPENQRQLANRKKKHLAIIRHRNTLPLVFVVESATRYNAMNMRVQAKILPPCVQHSEHTRFDL